MKKHFFYWTLPLFVFACNSNELPITADELEQLQTENTELKEQVEEIKVKDSIISDYSKFILEIQNNLNIIRQKENSLLLKSRNPELNSSDTSILSDLKLLGELLAENKSKTDRIKSKLKNANYQISELENVVLELTKQVETRDREIKGLKGELSDLGVAFDELLAAYEENISVIAEKIQTIEAQKDMLNTAYYAFGTSKELKENNVISKEGGFIGIGKTNKLKDDFNKKYFTEINIQETKEISLDFKKATLVTSHPEGSYTFEEADGKVTKLIITDAKNFWSVSKYLVIETK